MAKVYLVTVGEYCGLYDLSKTYIEQEDDNLE